MTEDTRLALRPDRSVLDPVRLSDVHARAALVPQTMGEVFEFAKMMASGRVGVPAFLVNNPGDCLRIVGIAARSGLDPFMLADDAHEVNKRMAFGAKAIHAIVLASGILDGDLALRFAGAGEDTTCTVTGRRRGGQPKSETYVLRTITTRNSPLWKQQSRQQLGYYAIRAWCRLHAPDALMGLVAREDAPIDVTTVEVAPPMTATERVAAALGHGKGDYIADQAAPETAAAAALGAQEEARASVALDGETIPGTPPHDPDTGELFNGASPQEKFQTDATLFIAGAQTVDELDAWAAENQGNLAALDEGPRTKLRRAFKAARDELLGKSNPISGG